MSDKGRIIKKELLNINISDHGLMNNFYSWFSLGFKNTIFLFDRGFNSKNTKEIWKKSNISFKTNNQFISPPHYKSSEKLTEEEKEIYKKRWCIETLFKYLKDEKGSYKLNFKSIRTNQVRNSLLDLVCFLWNYNYFKKANKKLC